MPSISSTASASRTMDNMPLTRNLHKISTILTPFATSGLRSLLHFLPAATKYLLFLLLLINARSFPLVWHFRIFRPVIWMRLQYRMLRMRLMFKPRLVQDEAEAKWFDSLTPIGANPFDQVVTYNSWASLDDSDFNGHLSNSSYAKTLDAARFKAALSMFPQFFRAGGWMPLAATHYNFIREIPMLAKYEVRISIGSWDQKWLYMICKFVTKPKSKKNFLNRQDITETTPTSNTVFHASLRTSADEISISASPMPTDTPTETTLEDTAKAMNAVTARLMRTEEPDGATLHTLTISQLCFKQGRITVPPAIVLAANGFSVPPSPAVVDGNGHVDPTRMSYTSSVPYSQTNPPPHWGLVKSLMSKPRGGSLKALQTFFKGGWRDIPEKERWWEDAVGGVVEERRKVNLEALTVVRMGTEKAGGLH